MTDKWFYSLKHVGRMERLPACDIMYSLIKNRTSRKRSCPVQ